MRNFGLRVILASLAVSAIFLAVILDVSTSGRIAVVLGGGAVASVFPEGN